MFGANPATLGRGVAAPTTPLLDALTNAPIGAWTMDLERAAYAGAGLRVRNATSNTETDIGFSAGVLNNTAMATALGTDGGSVSKWYNQVASGPDLVQSTGGQQPIIPSLGGGAYESAMAFANVYPQLDFALTLAAGGTWPQWMCSFVLGFDGAGDTTYQVALSYDGGSGDMGTGGAIIAHGFGGLIGVYQGIDGGGMSGIAAGYHTVTTYADGTNIGGYVDGVAGNIAPVAYGGAYLSGNGTLYIGSRYSGSSPWIAGHLKALIFWNTYNNADRLLAETWLRSKYGTP